MGAFQSVCGAGRPGDIAILASRDKDREVIILRDRNIVDVMRVAKSMTRITSFPTATGTAYFVSTRTGQTQLVQSGAKPKSFHLGEDKTDAIAACGGVPYIVGAVQRVRRWSGDGWESEEARLAAAVTRTKGAPSRGHVLVDVDGEPVVGLYDGGYGKTTLVRRAAESWRVLSSIDGIVNALTYRASDRTLFAVGAGVWAVPAKGGKARRVARVVPKQGSEGEDDSYWGACVAGDRLFAASYTGCDIVGDDGHITPSLTSTSRRDDIAWSDHPLAIVDGRPIVIWKNKLNVYDPKAGRWSAIGIDALRAARHVAA